MNDSKIKRASALPIAVLTAGLMIGGTGGAIAAAQIGTSDIKNDAVTSPKIKNGEVQTADLARSARGAKVVQYVVSGELLGSSQSSVRVTLPGIWTAARLANSTWTVELVRDSRFVFMLGNSAAGGEGTSDGFYIEVVDGVARVIINAPSYATIDTIRVTRTTRTSQAGGAVVARTAPRVQPRTGR